VETVVGSVQLPETFSHGMFRTMFTYGGCVYRMLKLMGTSLLTCRRFAPMLWGRVMTLRKGSLNLKSIPQRFVFQVFNVYILRERLSKIETPGVDADLLTIDVDSA